MISRRKQILMDKKNWICKNKNLTLSPKEKFRKKKLKHQENEQVL